MKKLFNKKEAADYIGVSRVTFYKIITRWGLKAKDHSGSVELFSIKDLDWVKQKIKESHLAS